MSKWGSPEEIENRRRIMVAVWAYAYEYLATPLVSDAKFDEECLKVNLKQPTRNKAMDNWFKKNFIAYTGSWVHSHPDKQGLERIARLLMEG